LPDKIIGNDGIPTTILEQGDDIPSSLQIAVSVQSNVNEGPSIEVFDTIFNTGKDELRNATK
jgi:hypothetical protein